MPRPFRSIVAAAATLVAACHHRPASVAPPPTPAEHAATVAAMRPREGARDATRRPVIAVLAANDGTETTDFLVPLGVLRRADVAEVLAVARDTGAVRLHPTLAIRADRTLATFDAEHPKGADYVIVPALHHGDDATVLAWIRAQAAKGATIVGVCSGVKVLGAAGLLDGRAATGHWHDRGELQQAHPTMRWVADRRYVVDRGVVTTTGISASLPASLALVEALGGHARADSVARSLGVASWDERHTSDAYSLSARDVRVVATNAALRWRHETLGLPVADGVDEIALAFAADAWSRTYRSRVVAIGERAGTITTRGGLTLLVDRDGGVDRLLPPAPMTHAASALDSTLAAIGRRYGASTATLVALQLEYP